MSLRAGGGTANDRKAGDHCEYQHPHSRRVPGASVNQTKYGGGSNAVDVP
jgi:hypothetical protein